ncbi:MAG: ABC transporter ATP-binding protein [Acidimicrobiales bacterium]
MPIVEVDHLRVQYGDVVAVDDLSFGADQGEITVVLGPNGAGKTSTIECLEGYRRPTSGTVRVCGLDPRADRAELNQRVGVMLQSGGIYTGIRPIEAVRLYASYYDNPRDPEPLLDFVGLGHRAKAAWRSLSGGEQQRLSLALAIIGRPDVVFLDEPTAGVDVTGRQLIRDLIRSLATEGVTVMLTTHDLAEVEALADRIVIIDNGRVVADSTPDELLSGDDADGFTFRAPELIDVTALGAAVRGVVTEVEPGRYRVSLAPTPATVATLTGWLANHDILLGDLQAGRQQLEEVFTKLTAEPDAAATARTRGRSGRA